MNKINECTRHDEALLQLKENHNLGADPWTHNIIKVGRDTFGASDGKSAIIIHESVLSARLKKEAKAIPAEAWVALKRDKERALEEFPLDKTISIKGLEEALNGHPSMWDAVVLCGYYVAPKQVEMIINISRQLGKQTIALLGASGKAMGGLFFQIDVNTTLVVTTLPAGWVSAPAYFVKEYKDDFLK